MFEAQFQYPAQPISIMYYVKEIELAGEVMAILGPKHIQSTIEINWRTPPRGWIKININGASKGNPGLAGCGGIIHDEEARWIGGFTCNLGICGPFMAKMWGSFYGLKLAWELGFRSILLESDSKLLVDMLWTGHSDSMETQVFLAKCKYYVELD